MTDQEALIAPLDSIKQLTFNFKNVSLATISHSHLSNCYWYSVIFRKSVIAQCFCEILDQMNIELDKAVAEEDYDKRTKLHNEFNDLNSVKDRIFFNVNIDEKCETNMHLYLRALKERFDGVILPYSPHPDFKFEFETLMTLKLLYCSSRGYDVIFKGKKIGEIEIL